MKTLVVLVLLAATVAVAANTAHAPADVQRAEKVSRAWLSTFAGKSQKEIVEKLGEPALRSSWEMNTTRQIMFRYDLSQKLRLEFFFVGENVSSISYQIFI